MERKELKRVIYEKDGPIARVIMNYPEKSNVQDEQMAWDFDECITLAENDWDVKVVIIKGNGRGFCAGHVIGTGFPSTAGKPPKAYSDLFLWPVLHLWECQKPTISQVHGYCLGGGTYFAYFTDMTVCSEDAYFQMPLVQGLGLPGGPPCVEPWIFQNWKQASKYMYTAQTLSAQEALRLGLVNDVVPRDQLEETVEEMARVIAQAPLATLLATKQQIKRAFEIRGMRVQIQASRDLFSMATGEEAQKWREERAKRPLQQQYPRVYAAQRAGQVTQSG
jgi:enoyl-CoA hydratase